MKQRIVFTGGHHNSALEIARALQKEGYDIYWIGHKFTSRGDKSLSAEFQEITAVKIPFYELKTGKFYRKTDPREYLKIIFGFFQSFIYLLKIRPQLIFSSGGYIAVPVCITGFLLRIPAITHEQTVIAGWANRAIAPFVKKILLTHPSSLKNYPKQKAEVVGLPLREELFSPKSKKKFKPPLLYITCGKQGSHVVNSALFPIIPDLVKHFTVVHQTGANTLTRDTDRARRVRDRLGSFSRRYLTAPYFFSDEATTYLSSAKLIVSRAGAHATYEIMALNKRSVLIPIPWVSHNEQFLNAKLTEKSAPTVILEEKDLTPENLLSAIMKAVKLPKKETKTNLPKNATEKIVHIIQNFLN